MELTNWIVSQVQLKSQLKVEGKIRLPASIFICQHDIC